MEGEERSRKHRKSEFVLCPMATFLFLSANKVPPDLSVRALPEGGSAWGRHHQVDMTEENYVGGGFLSLSLCLVLFLIHWLIFLFMLTFLSGTSSEYVDLIRKSAHIQMHWTAREDVWVSGTRTRVTAFGRVVVIVGYKILTPFRVFPAWFLSYFFL